MPRKFHYAADALSRKPWFDFMTVDEDFMAETSVTRRTFTRKDPKLKVILDAV